MDDPVGTLEPASLEPAFDVRPSIPSAREGSKGSRRRLPLLILGLSLLSLVPWSPMILRDEVPAYKDALYFFPGRRLYLEACQQQGVLPHWDPGRAYGQPGLGSPDNSAAYPVTQLAVWLVGGRRAMLLEGIFHTALAAILSLLFFRAVLRHDAGAMLGALAYALGGMTLGMHWNPVYFAGAAWLPGVALGVVSRRWPVTLLSLGAMALIPDPGMLACSFALIIAHCLVTAWRERRARYVTIPPLLAAGALCLGAAQILPMAEFLPLSTRSMPFNERMAFGHHVPLDVSRSLAMPLSLTSDHNFVYGSPWVYQLYIGFLAVFLVLHGLRHQWSRYLWVVLLAAVVMLAGIGERPPIFVLLYEWLPGFDRVRVAPKFLPLAALALGFLAARGWSADSPVWRGALWLGALLVLWHTVYGVCSQLPLVHIVFSMSGVAVTGIWLLARRRGWGATVVVLLFGLDLAFHAHLPSVPTEIPASSTLGSTLLREAAPGQRFAFLGPAPRLPLKDIPSELETNDLKTLYGSTCRLLGVDWAQDYWTLASMNTYRALFLKEVPLQDFPFDFVACERGREPGNLELELLAVENATGLYRRTDSPPNAEFDGTFETKRSMNRVEIDLRSERGSDLVFKETYLPGWRAWLDGEPVALTEAQGWCRRASVPPGAHSLVMEYTAPGAWGVWLSLFSWGLFLAFILATRKRRKPDTPSAQEARPPSTPG